MRQHVHFDGPARREGNVRRPVLAAQHHPLRGALALEDRLKQARAELAGLYLKLLRGIDALYPTPTPYIAAWHQAPVTVARDEIRLMLQLTSPRRAESKLKYLAGSEAAMGAWIGDVTPEASAAFIREGIERA